MRISPKSYRLSILFCWLLFSFLCLLHYLSLRELWVDETYVLHNIELLRLSRFLNPLLDNQVFPRFYLAVIRFISRPFDYHILSLRFLPLVCMICSFFIWIRIYAREFSEKWQVLLALLAFTSSYYASYYAAELKPYSMDVLVVSLFCLYFFYQKKAQDFSVKFKIITLLLPFTVLLSYAGFFVFWIVIYNFLLKLGENRKIMPLVILYSTLSFLCCAFVIWFDFRPTFSNQPVISYWQPYFLCSDSFYCFFKSFGEGLRKIVAWWYGDAAFFRRAASFFIPFFVFALFRDGFKSLFKHKSAIFDASGLALVIFAQLIILGVLGKYPFTGQRITLFFAPFVFLLTVKGLSYLSRVKVLNWCVFSFYAVFMVICWVNSLINYLKLYY